MASETIEAYRQRLLREALALAREPAPVVEPDDGPATRADLNAFAAVIREAIHSTRTSQLDSGVAARRADEPAAGLDNFVAKPVQGPLKLGIRTRDDMGRILKVAATYGSKNYDVLVKARNDMGIITEIEMVPASAQPPKEIVRPNWGGNA